MFFPNIQIYVNKKLHIKRIEISVNQSRKPYAGKLHVRFDEGGRLTVVFPLYSTVLFTQPPIIVSIVFRNSYNKSGLYSEILIINQDCIPKFL
jgi:hypothetical protein